MYIEKDFLYFVSSFSIIKREIGYTKNDLKKLTIAEYSDLVKEYEDFLDFSNSIDKLAEDENFIKYSKLN